MRLRKMILAGSALMIVSATASAQTTPPTQQTPPPPGMQKGMVTVINRVNGTIAIRAEQDNKDGAKAPDGVKSDGAKAPDGTKPDGTKAPDAAKPDAAKAPDGAKPDAAKAEGKTEQFKINAKLSETVHAGDKVKFSVSEANGVKTITKIEAE